MGDSLRLPGLSIDGRECFDLNGIVGTSLFSQEREESLDQREDAGQCLVIRPQIISPHSSLVSGVSGVWLHRRKQSLSSHQLSCQLQLISVLREG